VNDFMDTVLIREFTSKTQEPEKFLNHRITHGGITDEQADFGLTGKFSQRDFWSQESCYGLFPCDRQTFLSKI